MKNHLPTLPPIYQAAGMGDCPLLMNLLENGVYVSQNIRGSTPLHFAAVFDKPQAVRLLIEMGADLDAVGEVLH